MQGPVLTAARRMRLRFLSLQRKKAMKERNFGGLQKAATAMHAYGARTPRGDLQRWQHKNIRLIPNGESVGITLYEYLVVMLQQIPL